MKRRRTPKRNPKTNVANALVERHRWNLSLLREFIAKYGWAKLKPDTVVPPGVHLHRWVTHRRSEYKADKIADWLVPECEAIPGWSWSLFRDAHVRNLDNLRSFVKQHGWDALATRPVIDGARLDKWVHHRREEYRLGELDDWLIRGLEALPGWTWDPRRAGYERNLQELREHVELYGLSSLHEHTLSRRGSKIGHWAGKMRAMHRRGELEEWIAKELESIPGWTWEPRVTRQQDNIARLAAFVQEHGWDAVSDALVVEGVKLGDWISNCRMRYRNGTLSEDTIAGLEAIPGWQWPGRSTWYQPKDDAGRFIRIRETERVRMREPPPKRLRRSRSTTSNA
jgi:hypothetical protein